MALTVQRQEFNLDHIYLSNNLPGGKHPAVRHTPDSGLFYLSVFYLVA